MARVSLRLKTSMLAAGMLAARTAPAADCGPTPYDCAVAQVTRQDFPAAIRSLDEVLRAAPRELKALNLLGIALTGAGRIDEANRRFRQALAIDATFYPALKNLAVNEFTRGEYGESQRHFEEVLKLAPGDDVAHVHLAEIHFKKNRLAGALEHYEKAGARVAQDNVWTLHHARCLLASGRTKDAVSALGPLSAKDADAQFQAGVMLGEAGEHAAAAAFFGRARSGYRDPSAAAYNQVLMLIRGGQAEEALRVAEALVAAGPQPTELHRLMSEAYLKQGRIKEAYDALRTATPLEPKNEELYLDLAAICLDHDNLDLGLEIADVGLGQRPDSLALRLQRGVMLAMKGQVAQAEAEFDRARGMAPQAAAPYVALAMAWMQTGRTERAVAVLRERGRAGDKSAVIPYMLAVAILRSGADPAGSAGAEAVAALEDSVRLDPGFPGARAELGKLLLKRGEVEPAIRQLEKAVSLDRENPAAAYALAQAYFRTGAKDRAETLMAQVSRFNARQREGIPDDELRRIVVRIVREGTAHPASPAAAEFREAARLDPRRAGARYHLGLALERMGEPRAAIGEFQHALSLEPELVEAHYGLASACAAVGDLDGAILLLRRVVEKAPGFAEARYNLGVDLWNRYKSGRGLRDKADLDEAARQLEAAGRLDPSQPKVHFALGQLQAERQSLIPAVASLQKAVELAPEDPQYTYNLGLALRLQGDLDAAEARLRQAIERDPKHALARRALGLLLRQKGDLAGAATELRLSVAELPGDAQAHHLLGSVLLRLDDPSAAIDELRAATRLDPLLTEARVLLAQALLKAGRRDEAQVEQAEAQRINAEKGGLGRAMVLMEGAAAQIKKRERVAAITQLREAARLSPDFPEAHYRLGLALRDSRTDAAEAEAAFVQVLKLDPGQARARYELGRLFLARGDAEGAAFQFAQAVEAAPSLVEARRARARIALRSHDWDGAAADLRALVAWEPGDAKAHRDLATALEARGETAEASREREAARRLESTRK